jgi:hypothetical protein
VTTAVLDQLEDRLAHKAAGPLRRTDSGSVARYEFEFPVPPPPSGPWGGAGPAKAPVVLTVYKRYGRARIQVLTHQLQRAQAQALQQRVAAWRDSRSSSGPIRRPSRKSATPSTPKPPRSPPPPRPSSPDPGRGARPPRRVGAVEPPVSGRRTLWSSWARSSRDRGARRGIAAGQPAGGSRGGLGIRAAISGGSGSR